MKFSFFVNNTFSNDMAIDLGTEMTSIYIQGQGIVLKEPSCIAYDAFTHQIQAVGTNAREMLGKTPDCVKVVRPVSGGVISDFEMTCQLLKGFISSICKRTVLKPRVIASVPAGSTEVEQHAIIDALKTAGVREVYLIEEPLAAASGAGCDISLARGMLIADIGGGRCDVSSISLGHSVISKSITTAGNSFTEEIIKYIKKNNNLNIGVLTADSIKTEVGCAYPFEKPKTIQVFGCDATTGLPRSANVNSEEIRAVFSDLLKRVANIIKMTLEDTPPELQSDILEDGILITGGGGRLSGIDKFLRAELGIKVFTAENMEDCVIEGAGQELLKLDSSGSPSQKYFFSL